MTKPTNPYIAGNPVRGKNFFGRTDILQWVTQELSNPGTNALVLFGQRRVGKTTLLLQLQYYLPKQKYHPIFFDLQYQTKRSMGQVLDDLAEKMDDSIHADLPREKMDDRGKYFQKVFLPGFLGKIQQDIRLVFLFDEFDVLDETSKDISDTSAANSLFPFLRQLMADFPSVAFVFIAGRNPEDLSLDFGATFKASLVKEIWVLDPESAHNLICQAEINKTLKFTDSAISFIVNLTHNHPYMIQLLCQRIWERAHKNSRAIIKVIDEKFVAATLPDALAVGTAAFNWLWNGISLEEQIFASAFAEKSIIFQELTLSGVSNVIKENAKILRISERERPQEKLLKRHILKIVKEEGIVTEEKYCFEIDLFRQWIKDNQPLDAVKRSIDQKLNPEADRHYQYGRICFDKGELDNAIYYCKQALSLNNQHVHAQLLLSESHLENKNIDDALIEVQKAYDLDPKESQNIYLRILQEEAEELIRIKHLLQAIGVCREITAIDPSNQIALELLGKATFAQEIIFRNQLFIILAILTFSCLPVFLAFNKITNDNRLSILFAILYWVAIIIAGIGVTIWRQSKRKIISFFQATFSTYRSRYLEYLIYQHRVFDVKGLGTQGPFSLELERVYVQLDVDPTPLHVASSNPLQGLPDRVRSGSHTIWEYLSGFNAQNNAFVILGAPGSGKTTLLKNITLTLAGPSSQRRKQGIPNSLPVLLFLRDHVHAILENSNIALDELIRGQFISRQAPLPPLGWLRANLERGNCLIMFDGMDEIANTETRKKVLDWLEKCMVAFSRNTYILSSRPYGYRMNPLENATVLQIRPFSFIQVEQFVHNWYLANEIMSNQKDDPGVRVDARNGAEDLISRIRSTNTLADLAVNPLLLTMIATVHRYRSSLPGRRVELYAEICEVFLGKRQQARGITLDLTPAQKVRVLRVLAFHMLENEIRGIDVKEAVKVISKPLSAVMPEITGEQFLTDVENTSGLLIEFENGKYSFSNLIFQEYLASIHIIQTRLEYQMLKKINSYWWHETILLYSAQEDASEVIAACLKSENTVTLSLAIECMEEAREVNPEVRTRFQNTMENGIEDPNPERRKLIAAALLKRRTR